MAAPSAEVLASCTGANAPSQRHNYHQWGRVVVACREEIIKCLKEEVLF